MSSTGDIEAIKQRRENLRDKIKRRKQELQTLGVESTPKVTSASAVSASTGPKKDEKQTDYQVSKQTEKKILEWIGMLELPLDLTSLHNSFSETSEEDLSLEKTEKIILRFEEEGFLRTEKSSNDASSNLTLISIDKQRISGLSGSTKRSSQSLKRKRDDSPSKDENVPPAKVQTTSPKEVAKAEEDSVESLLSSTTFKEQESKEMGKEIFDLLSVPTVKEQTLAEKFKSKEGTVREFCSRGTREECSKVKPSCDKLHFKRIIKEHTDESLGDCSFLNTCFHMDTCKYVHYQVENSTTTPVEKTVVSPAKKTERSDSKLTMLPAQWIQCDIRYLDNSVLGKYAVIMADPPWDIHMELPYGTMQDDEMRKLDIPSIQDDGFLFLWVTGRAMELGRECLRLWGYKQVEELIWVKTNQLQRLIRTGRTGHWLNHGKEHCLVGIKGNPEGYNKGLDCDVVVAEVRQTSHKPDEIYGLIERLSPGTRKIEFFGRMHNVQPNWVTLGNQLDGVHLVEPELIKKFQEKYPDMNAMKPPSN